MTRALITLSLPEHARTFADPDGVTHEAIDTNHRIGTLSLCGRLREPALIVDKTLDQVRGFASPEAPEGVDCMTCLVRRVRLDVMIAEEYAGTEIIYPMIQLDLRIAP